MFRRIIYILGLVFTVLVCCHCFPLSSQFRCTTSSTLLFAFFLLIEVIFLPLLSQRRCTTPYTLLSRVVVLVCLRPAVVPGVAVVAPIHPSMGPTCCVCVLHALLSCFLSLIFFASLFPMEKSQQEPRGLVILYRKYMFEGRALLQKLYFFFSAYVCLCVRVRVRVRVCSCACGMYVCDCVDDCVCSRPT